jgi:hypothetical protein
MKFARILIFASVILVVGYGLNASLRAWGQNGQPPASGLELDANLAPVPVQAGQLLSLPSRRGSDVELDKLLQEEASAEREVVHLVQSYAHSEGDTQRSRIKSSLATALAKEFDLQQKRRDVELARMEARLKKVRELMQKRSDARQSIIEKRLDQLLREAEGLGWTPPAGINVPQLQDGQRLLPR